MSLYTWLKLFLIELENHAVYSAGATIYWDGSEIVIASKGGLVPCMDESDMVGDPVEAAKRLVTQIEQS